MTRSRVYVGSPAGSPVLTAMSTGSRSPTCRRRPSSGADPGRTKTTEASTSPDRAVARKSQPTQYTPSEPPPRAELTQRAVIALVPLGDLDPRIDPAGICLVLESQLWIPCAVLPPQQFPDEIALDPERNQWRAGKVLAALHAARPAIEAIRAHARRAEPEECCGLLFGRPGLIEEARAAANVAEDPARRFEIDPQALIDAHRAARSGGANLIGYYHSHPKGSARPSVVDETMAARDGGVWAIAAADGVTFWRDGERGFEPLSYALEDR